MRQLRERGVRQIKKMSRHRHSASPITETSICRDRGVINDPLRAVNGNASESFAFFHPGPDVTFPRELTCPEHGACPPAGRIDLADAVARFDREAARGSVDTGRYRMRYYTWGQGPPLVFIHGVGDWSRSVLMV